jgi:hypothetical protein
MISEKYILSLISKGYRRTSNKYGMVSRVDRSDWREYMAKHHTPWDIKRGLEWVEALGDSASDYYRRVLSKDSKEFGREYAKFFPSSSGSGVGWVEP